MDIKDLRESIDLVDSHILTQLQKRYNLTKEIGKLKKGAIKDDERETEILRTLLGKNKNIFPEDILQKIYYLIFTASYKAEKEIIEKKGTLS